MATYAEILLQILAGIDSVPDEYSAAVKRVQDEVFRSILPLLDKMKLDENGAVIANAANYATAAMISEELPNILDRAGMTDAIKNFASGLDEQKALTETLYETIIDDPKFRDLSSMWKASRSRAVNMMGESAVNTYVSEFTTAINNAIGSSSTFTQTISAIRSTTIGNPEIDGILYRYAKQNAKDAFSITNREYSEQINRKYGIVFYRYVGGTKDTTRVWCLDHVGNYYHKSDIEAMASQQWAGKARGTNASTIFTKCGGYNCDHIWSPVPVDKVPVEVLQDAIDRNLVNAADLPKRVLDKLGIEVES